MISDHGYVWIFLPGATTPVPAGIVYWSYEDQTWAFRYAKSYQQRGDAIPMAPPGCAMDTIDDDINLLDEQMNGALRDASPDAWGRKVMARRLRDKGGDPYALDEVDFLLGGGPDRVGALDVTDDKSTYQPGDSSAADLDELLEAAERVEAGEPLDERLDKALNHGTSIGGARPKALLEKNGEFWIAKFSSSSDYYPMVAVEVAAMWLARDCGLDVADASIESVMKKQIALIKRFDRVPGDQGIHRRHQISAMTLLNLNEDAVERGEASYLELADVLLKHSRDPDRDLRELFARIVFNILVGNTDDHARNHACFWDGQYLDLTPAYDVCPQPRHSYSTKQAMEVGEQGRQATLSNALSVCSRFNLSTDEAQEIIDFQRSVIEDRVRQYLSAFEVSSHQVDQLIGNTLLSPSIDD